MHIVDPKATCMSVWNYYILYKPQISGRGNPRGFRDYEGDQILRSLLTCYTRCNDKSEKSALM